MKSNALNETILEKEPAEAASKSITSTWLTYNILPFRHPEAKKEMCFTTEKREGCIRFRIDKLPGIARTLFPHLKKDEPFVYTDFTSSGTGKRITVDMNDQTAIASAYYHQRIMETLKNTASVFTRNFLHDPQFWYDSREDSTNDFMAYHKFTLHVQHDHKKNSPELEITYDGLSYTTTLPLSKLIAEAQLDIQLIHQVIFRKRLYLYTRLPDTAMYHTDEIYPVLHRELSNVLNITIPRKPILLKYPEMYNKIDTFFKKYLDTGEFRKIIPFTAGWKKVDSSECFRIRNTANELVFGEGNTGQDVLNSIRNHGPHRLSPYRNIKFFFIYSNDDKIRAEELYQYIIRKKGFIHLSEFTRLPMHYTKELNIITFGPNPVEEIRERISHVSLDPDCSHFAFYVSPYGKFEPDPVKRTIYYQIKELLLRCDISMQAIERDHILSEGFKYFISNIGIATIAKLGGIPWRLNQEVEKELIVGFGAFCTQQYKRKYIGSAFCFSNDGTFREFDCFPSDETWALAGTVADALQRYRNEKPDVERLIIHFHKKMSEKELLPIEKKLRELNLGIPVIIVSIYKTLSENHLVFDNGYKQKMPLNGSYFHLGNHQYLLCVNQRNNETSVVKTCPLPLKLELQSNDTKLINDPELVERLMKQVYSFCFMHWRTVKQPPIPVTVRYPEMLAQMFPWFDSEVLPEYGKKTLWFL